MRSPPQRIIAFAGGFRGRNMAASWRTNPKLVCVMTIESLSHGIAALKVSLAALKSDKEKVVVTL